MKRGDIINYRVSEIRKNVRGREVENFIPPLAWYFNLHACCTPSSSSFPRPSLDERSKEVLHFPRQAWANTWILFRGTRKSRFESNRVLEEARLGSIRVEIDRSSLFSIRSGRSLERKGLGWGRGKKGWWSRTVEGSPPRGRGVPYRSKGKPAWPNRSIKSTSTSFLFFVNLCLDLKLSLSHGPHYASQFLLYFRPW